MKRICYITPRSAPYPGGIATSTDSITSVLAEAGFAITVITLNAGSQGVRKGISYSNVNIGKSPFELVLLGLLKILHLHDFSFWSLVNLKTLILFTKLHRSNHFQIVINHDYYSTAYLINRLKSFLKRLYPFQMVVRISGPLKILESEFYFPHPLEKKLILKAELGHLKRADWIIYPSEIMLNLIKKEVKLPLDNSIRISTPLPKLLIPKLRKENICLYVGRIQDGKGIEDLLSAWVGIEKDLIKNFKLKIVGGDTPFKDGSSYKTYLVNTYLNKYSLPGTVEFKGLEDRTDLAKELARAKFLIAPSRMENYPNTVAEAILAGCFVIGTEGTGVEEILRFYKYNLFSLVPAKSPASLSAELVMQLSLQHPNPDLGTVYEINRRNSARLVSFLNNLP